MILSNHPFFSKTELVCVNIFRSVTFPKTKFETKTIQFKSNKKSCFFIPTVFELKLLAAETDLLMTADLKASDEGRDLKDIVPLWANSAFDLLAEMSSWKH